MPKAKRSKKDLEGLPSWVPDWTRIENETPFIRHKDIIHFDASAGLRPFAGIWPRVTDDNELVLFGVAVDVVQKIGPLTSFKKSGIYQRQLDDISSTSCGKTRNGYMTVSIWATPPRRLLQLQLQKCLLENHHGWINRRGLSSVFFPRHVVLQIFTITR